MAWVRLDDGFFRHPKAIKAGRDGRAMFLAGLCWTAANLTDGRIPKEVVRMLAAETETKQAGLWRDEGDVYVIPDYLEFGNPSKESTESERARWREQKQNQRRRHRPDDVRDVSTADTRTVSADKPGVDMSACPGPYATQRHVTKGVDLSAAAALRCREAPAAAAAAVDLILTIRERQQEGRVLHPVVWRTKTRPKIAEEFADQIAGYLAGHPDAGAEEIVTAGCGFTRWDIPA
jgi:hypothetical protein